MADMLQHAPSPTNGYREDSHESKRRKRDERSRVSRACDRCKRKKTRCSGRKPCTLCVKASMSCDFTAAYNRGRVPSIVSDDEFHDRDQTDSAPARNAALGDSDQAIQDMRIDNGMQSLLQAALLPQPGQGRLDSRMQSLSRNSPEPSQTDLQGHYVGPASGVSFLLRVQNKLHQKVCFSPTSSIFTFGDAPLPEFDSSFFILPPRADAQRLVARYFDFAVPTHRFLHRPTIEAWLEEFYENLGVMRHKERAKERTALLFMVFAQAEDYMPDSKGSSRYFQAADHQLSSETGEIRLTSVQVRLCQCLYLLAHSRMNHCWSLWGTTAHLILAIGIHRKRRIETSNGVDAIELECRKRVFWCAYSLDNYLSAALGRPRTFHDDDIDQDLPLCISDSNITSQGIIPSNSKSQSVMMAPVAHAMLSKIVSHILRYLYPLRPPVLPTRVALTAQYADELLDWRKKFARFLDAELGLLTPLFQRQCNVLNLAYYHALILVHRPFLLSNFASLNSRNRPRGAPGTPDADKNVSECLEAAMNIANIVDELTEGKQTFRAFWFTQYFAFCAVVVLYVYTIQQTHSPREKYIAYFKAAAKCQVQITSMAEEESLAQRYSVVLEELRLEASSQTQSQQESQTRNTTTAIHGRNAVPPLGLHTNGNGTSVTDERDLTIDGVTFETADDMIAHDGPSGTTPSSLMAELTGWGEFNSLITAGMGGLDYLFGEQNHEWDMHGVNGMG